MATSVAAAFPTRTFRFVRRRVLASDDANRQPSGGSTPATITGDPA